MHFSQAGRKSNNSVHTSDKTEQFDDTGKAFHLAAKWLWTNRGGMALAWGRGDTRVGIERTTVGEREAKPRFRRAHLYNNGNPWVQRLCRRWIRRKPSLTSSWMSYVLSSALKIPTQRFPWLADNNVSPHCIYPLSP